jgi:transcriptional regulator with XRE-family HTH domain
MRVLRVRYSDSSRAGGIVAPCFVRAARGRPLQAATGGRRPGRQADDRSAVPVGRIVRPAHQARKRLSVRNRHGPVATRRGGAIARLARRAIIPASTLRNWENDRGFPDMPAGVRLAEALGVPVERLAEGVDDPAQEEAEAAEEQHGQSRHPRPPLRRSRHIPAGPPRRRTGRVGGVMVRTATAPPRPSASG